MYESITYAELKSLPRDQKIEALKELMATCSSRKKIAEKLGVNPPNIYSMIARYIKEDPARKPGRKKGRAKGKAAAKAKAKAGIHEPMQAAEQEPGYAAEQEQGYTAKQGPGSAQISSETGVSGRLVSDAFASIQVPGDASAELLAGEVTVSGQYREDSPANGQVRAEIIENTQIWAEIAGSTKIGAEVIEGAQFREGISADAQPTGKISADAHPTGKISADT
ncbi:MAG: hypothetical protein GX940_01500, partial [Clostridiaceae bacterium]|nr:hypothetical protein [Clostridiaceae bacterium]